MKKNVLQDFQICISVPLKNENFKNNLLIYWFVLLLFQYNERKMGFLD